MSRDQDNDAEKSHEPSQRKLDEARKRGDIPRSMDLVSAAVYGGAILAILITGTWSVETFGSAAMGMIEQSERISTQLVRGGMAATGDLLVVVALPFLPILLLPMVGAILAVMAQRAFVLSTEKIEPKASRINPWTVLKERFGPDGLFNWVKGLVKMLAICLVVAWLVPGYFDRVMGSVSQEARQSSALMMQIIVDFLILSLLVSLVLGGLDYGWQWLQHRKRNMMTRQEAIEEHKDQEGDPFVKMQRRDKGRQIAMSQMLVDVAKADVVIVNPTHYAVALKWKRGDRNAPVCVAKGVDEIAARIREKAIESGVPLHSDPPTARAIFATVEVGDPIRPEHYKPVAAAIRFAEAMRKRARRPR